MDIYRYAARGKMSQQMLAWVGYRCYQKLIDGKSKRFKKISMSSQQTQDKHGKLLNVFDFT
jgi:hypothetical protein